MLDAKGIDLAGKTIVVSGSGNVATYAIEKAQEYGAKVVTCSDSNGYIYDPEGIDLAAVKEIKQVRRGRIKEYVETHPQAEYHEGCRGVWTVKCDIVLPCATQGEIDLASAKTLVANGVTAVGEGANMPRSTPSPTSSSKRSSSRQPRLQMPAVSLSQPSRWRRTRSACSGRSRKSMAASRPS